MNFSSFWTDRWEANDALKKCHPGAAQKLGIASGQERKRQMSGVEFHVK